MLQESESDADVVYKLVYSEPLDHRGPVDLGNYAIPEHPVGEFIAKVTDDLSKKNAVVNPGCETDIYALIAETDDLELGSEPLSKRTSTDWNEVIGTPRIQLSRAFLERSDARLARVAAKIREVFGEHREEAEEAISIAKTIRDAERRAMA